MSQVMTIPVHAIDTGQPCGSVTQWLECLHDVPEVLGLSPSWAMCFSSPVTFGGQNGSVLGLRAAKGTVSSIQGCLRADPGQISLSRGKVSQVNHVAR